jgi:hypothetical protein
VFGFDRSFLVWKSGMKDAEARQGPAKISVLKIYVFTIYSIKVLTLTIFNCQYHSKAMIDALQILTAIVPLS